ncbi:unnamed protein product, partial [Ectocarpus sp. 8 AP-2014]
RGRGRLNNNGGSGVCGEALSGGAWRGGSGGGRCRRRRRTAAPVLHLQGRHNALGPERGERGGHKLCPRRVREGVPRDLRGLPSPGRGGAHAGGLRRRGGHVGVPVAPVRVLRRRRERPAARGEEGQQQRGACGVGAALVGQEWRERRRRLEEIR